jgi:hypothetical protein
LRLPIAMSLMLIGCAEVDKTHADAVDADGIAKLYADLDRGQVTYEGRTDADAFAFEVRSWGRGGSKARASAKEISNDWGLQFLETEVTAWARSPTHTAGVDFAFSGPSRMDVEIVTLEGDVTLSGVDGAHVVTADSILGEAVSGDADLYAARGGIRAEIYPDFGSLVILQAIDGEVVLGLPFGLQYDIEVFGDWDYPMDVQDLGFDDVVMSPGYFTAFTGGGNVVVQVFVEGGGFYLYEAPPI